MSRLVRDLASISAAIHLWSLDIGDGLDPSFRGHLDSLQLELLEGRIAVRAKLRTAAPDSASRKTPSGPTSLSAFHSIGLWLAVRISPAPAR